MEEARDTSKFINAGSDRCENYMNLLIHYVSVRVYEVVILHIFFSRLNSDLLPCCRRRSYIAHRRLWGLWTNE